MTVEKLKQAIPRFQQNVIHHHNADFMACGAHSYAEHARRIIQSIQKVCRTLKSPVIYTDFEAFTYLQTGEMVSGFLTSTEDFVCVGDLSAGRVPIQYSREILDCSSCGTKALPVHGKCVKCSNPHRIKHEGATIPIYTTTAEIIPRADYWYAGYLWVVDGEEGYEIQIQNMYT